MIIGCPECATKFGIPDGALGESGRKVRCAKCGNVWLATTNDAIEEKPQPQPQPEPQSEPQPEPEVAHEPDLPAEDEFSHEGDDFNEADGMAEESEPTEGTQIEDDGSEELKGIGDSSVEEALAVIKGTSIEEPDFPLAKGEIGEFSEEKTSKTLIIGWASLGVFVTTLLLVFFLMQDSLRSVWPPITKLYDAVGMVDKPSRQAAEEQAEVDHSKFIRITNDAAVERLSDGTPALVIRGSVTNTASFDIELPKVEVVLRNERRQDIYTWPFEFDETVLKAGKTMPFIEAVTGAPQETTEFELMLLWER